MTQARQVSHHASPLGVLAFDAANHVRRLATHPGDTRAQRARADLLARANRAREACAIYQGLVTRTPEDPELLAEYLAVRNRVAAANG